MGSSAFASPSSSSEAASTSFVIVLNNVAVEATRPAAAAAAGSRVVAPHQLCPAHVSAWLASTMDPKAPNLDYAYALNPKP